MDKKLNRTIGYVKPSGVSKPEPKKEVMKEEPKITPEIEEIKEVVPEPEIDLLAILKAEKIKAKKIVNWINEHEEFKWGGMCTKLGVDRGNFQRVLNAEEPNIRIELILQIEGFLKEYGYAK